MIVCRLAFSTVKSHYAGEGGVMPSQKIRIAKLEIHLLRGEIWYEKFHMALHLCACPSMGS